MSGLRGSCVVLEAAVLALALSAGCGDSDTPTTPTPATPTIIGLMLSQTSVSMARHGTVQLKATLQRSDGTSEVVTDNASWSSSAPETVLVQRGLLVGVTMGTAKVTAGYGGYLAAADVAVYRNMTLDMYLSASAFPAAGQIVADFDGTKLGECAVSGMGLASGCYLGYGYGKPAWPLTPGTHTVTVTYTPTSSTGASFEFFTYGAVTANDGDTGDSLGSFSLDTRRFTRTSSTTVTWTIDVPVFR
jgi:hypothetical protein